jgi:hypothetical protein
MKGALLLLALAAPVAWACGVCVEDKVAATYDYAVVQRALARGQVVVYCEVSGRADAAQLRHAAVKVPALDAASLRISAEPAALSFALDTARQSPKAAVAALQHALPAGTHVHIIRLATAKGLQTATR